MSGTTVMTRTYQASTTVVSGCKLDILLSMCCGNAMWRNGAEELKRTILYCKRDIAKGAKSGDRETHMSEHVWRNGKMALSELHSMFVG